MGQREYKINWINPVKTSSNLFLSLNACVIVSQHARQAVCKQVRVRVSEKSYKFPLPGPILRYANSYSNLNTAWRESSWALQCLAYLDFTPPLFLRFRSPRNRGKPFSHACPDCYATASVLLHARSISKAQSKQRHWFESRAKYWYVPLVENIQSRTE